MIKQLLYRLVLSSLALIFLMSTLILAQMPPHPQLVQKISSGMKKLPQRLQQINTLRQRGIDAPWADLQLTQQRSFIPNHFQRSFGPAHVPTGTYNALVILVQFSDKQKQVPSTYFDNLLFSTSSNTLRDYYSKISYNNLDIVTVNLPSTIGWTTAPQTYSYYVNGDNGFGSYPMNAQKLVEDVVNIADPVVNYSDYDNDNDGDVDALFILHAGPGAEYTGSSNDIWSHAWTTNTPLNLDGVQVYRYSMEPEYWASPGDMTCGVFAHEMGHSAFGLPDLYDRDYSSMGLGDWSLMAGGSWNGASGLGESPAFPDAWTHAEMGYVSPTVVTSNLTNQTIANIESTPQIYLLWKNGVSGSQYFLVENRQKTSYDTYIPASGLHIYHVDESVTSQNDNEWYPNHTSSGHYMVALEQADGLWNLEKDNNSGDSGDPFPGSNNKLNFDDTSIPNSKDYGLQQTFVSVKNISSSSLTMTADFDITLSSPLLTILSPIGGEYWKCDQTRKITWNSALIDSISIEYSTDNGSTWVSVCQKYPAAGGSYDWVIPSGISSEYCKIKLTDPTSGINAISGNTFSITPYLPIPRNLTADVNQKTGEVNLNWGSGNSLGFYEDFEDGIADNFVFLDNRYSVSNGYLKMNGLSNNTTAIAYYNEDFNNFTLEYKFRRTQGQTSFTIGAYLRADQFTSSGIMNGYEVCIAVSGGYSIWIVQNGSHSSIVPWTQTSFINAGLNVDNIATITADGSKITLYINGHYCCEVDNSAYTNGRIGLWTYDASGSTNEILWDYVSLTNPILLTSSSETSSLNQKVIGGGGVNSCPSLEASNNTVPVIGFLEQVSSSAVFENFNVYRDNTKIGSPVDSSFTDILSLSGTYKYTIKTKYAEGESGPSAPCTVKYNAGPAIFVSTSKLSSSIIGENKDTLKFTIKNIGTGQLNYTISDTSITALIRQFTEDKDGPNSPPRTGKILTKVSYSATWLDETPLSGILNSDDSVVVSVIFNAINLTPGTFQGSIKISSNDIFSPVVNIQAILVKSLENITTNDNENNLGHGISDGDLDAYIEYSSSIHPIEFNIFINEPVITSSVLSILAYDVDSNSGEKDLVKVNGHTLGYLSGSESEWVSTVFNVDPSWLNHGPNGKNLIQIYVDEDHSGWLATVDWGQFILNGNVGSASFRYVNLNKPAYRLGEIINVTEEIDAVSPMNIKVTTQLISPTGQVISSRNRNLIATSGDESFIEPFTLQTYYDPGIYQIMAVVYDLSTNIQQDIIYKNVNVKGPITLTGQVTDAITGLPVGGATVNIGNLSVQTNAQGNYTISNIPEGALIASFNAYPTSGTAPLDVQFTDLSSDNAHTVSVSKNGYSGYANTNTILNSSGNTILNISLSPVLQTGMIRIVLNWREHPTDIDAHLKTPFIQGNSHHIYYANRGAQQQPPYAEINIDDFSSYGPETITIYQLCNGTYRYFIHNFSRASGKDSSLKYSNAVVQIYNSQGLVKTINCPTSGDGLYWYVCDINGVTGNITEVNQFTLTEPGLNAVSKTILKNKNYTDIQPLSSVKVSSTLPNVTHWFWEFGDGTSSTDQNPTHKYQMAGIYTVRLTASNEFQQNIKTITNYISVVNGGPIRLISPNGGEYWQEGVAKKIKWSSSGIDSVKIEYSSDSCQTWNTIIESYSAGKNYYDWIIPEGITSAAKIRISSVENSVIGDSSDNFFSVLSSTAHSVSLPSIEAASGDSIIIPLNVNNFNNVGSITLRIQYDQSVLNFIEALNCNSQISGTLINTQSGVVTIAWDNLNGVNLGTDKLLDLKFYYNGSFNPTALLFNTNHCEITDPEGNSYASSYNDGEVYRIINISGQVLYDNSTHTPITNANLKLLLGNNVIDSVITDNAGRYKFNGIINGTYKIEIGINKQWGGVNSTDALLIRRHIVSLDTLSSFRQVSADVNASSTITSSDALTIRRRVAGLISSFSKKDWLFEAANIIVNGENVVRNIRGICTGDVNGSFNPSLAKVTSAICLNSSEILKTTGTDEVTIPIKINNDIELGAMTLILDLPTELFEVKSVICKANNVLYNIKEGKLTILWDDVEPIKIKANEDFISLVVETKDKFAAGKKLTIGLDEESEFADINGNIISGLKLTIPVLETAIPKEYKLSQNYPNPFNPSTTIEYDLPEDARVTIEIYNILGEKITTLVNKNQEPGSYKINWNASNLPSGIYFFRINADGKGNSFTKINKMSLIK